MKKHLKLFLASLFVIATLLSCGGSSGVLSTPIENIDNTPIKVLELTENEQRIWGHLDLAQDTVPGMSIIKAYDDIIKNKKGVQTIVAVIDTGIDIDHEDLDGVIWKNNKEIPNNGKDDDNNGYVDDIYGWNFLGDTYNEQFEYVRLLASGDSSNPKYAEALTEYNKDYQKYTSLKAQNVEVLQIIIDADAAVSKHLNKKEYTKEDVNAIKTENEALAQNVSIIKQTYGFGFKSISEAKQAIKKQIDAYGEILDYHLDKTLKGRKTGDNPDDFSDNQYGNNNIKPPFKDESHGTHVAGIIAAERNNNIGAMGVANNVKIMSLRVVPNGDEYDKDVALAIRYAADNGAKIINMSFGKYYSPHSDWVREAIVYAAKKDVLIVTGAGNESLDLDAKANYPNDQVNNGPEISDNYISVGAIGPKYGAGLVADYSNYGKINVDVFAPGDDIYSSYPNNTYESISGTSMASPAVAGVAALIRSQYPSLKASQVKQIIIDSGLSLPTKVIVGGNPGDIRAFGDLSKSGKIVNAYNALIMASKL